MHAISTPGQRGQGELGQSSRPSRQCRRRGGATVAARAGGLACRGVLKQGLPNQVR